jgi:hypothetical protein
MRLTPIDEGRGPRWVPAFVSPAICHRSERIVATASG